MSLCMLTSYNCLASRYSHKATNFVVLVLFHVILLPSTLNPKP